jgi:hypothetical protein
MTDYADIEPISNSDLALRCSSWRLGDRSLDPRLIWDRLNFKQKEFARSEARKNAFSLKCAAVRRWREGPPGTPPPPGVGLYVWAPVPDSPAELDDDEGTGP